MEHSFSEVVIEIIMKKGLSYIYEYEYSYYYAPQFFCNINA
jgi:hypothetical protein